MKRIAAVLCVALFATVAAYGQSLDPADRDRAMKYLEATKKGVVEATKGLSAYEWILFIAAHSERHTKQINEVKADPSFPKQ